MNLLFVGDVHLNPQTPISRKDDNPAYPTYVLQKIEMVGQIAKQNNVSKVIFLGDIFNYTNISTPFLGRSIDAFNTIKYDEISGVKTRNNIELYSIIGNHDMVYRNDELFNNTPLDLLFKTKTINHLSKLDITPNISIYGFDYDKEIKSVNDTKYNICCAHAFYDNSQWGSGNSNITPEQAKLFGYNIYILGHDHSPYEDVVTPGYKVIRHGSLTRATSKTCNLHRGVDVTLFNTDTFEITRIPLPVKPAEEVFKTIKYIEKSEDLNLRVDDIINNLNFSAHDSIYDVMKSMRPQVDLKLKEESQPTYDLITKYLESHSVFDIKGVTHEN